MHDAFFCSTMADVWMNGGKRKIGSCDAACVVGKSRILGGFRECSTDLVVLLNVDDDNLTVLAMPLNGCSMAWQSLSIILLLVDEHGCSGGCQAVGCGSIVVRIM